MTYRSAMHLHGDLLSLAGHDVGGEIALLLVRNEAGLLTVKRRPLRLLLQHGLTVDRQVAHEGGVVWIVRHSASI